VIVKMFRARGWW